MKTYTTRFNRTIPAHVMQTVRDRVHNLDDWQTIMTDELRDYIPEHEDDEITAAFNEQFQPA